MKGVKRSVDNGDDEKLNPKKRSAKFVSTRHCEQLKASDSVYYVECYTDDELRCLHDLYQTRIKYKGLYYTSVKSAVIAQKFIPSDRVLFAENGIFSDWNILKTNLFFGEKKGNQIINVFRKIGMIGIIANLVGLNRGIAARFHLTQMSGEVTLPREECLKLLWAKFSYPELKNILLGNTTRGREVVGGSSRSPVVKKGGYTGTEVLLQFDGLHRDSLNKVGFYGAHVNKASVVVGHNFNGNLLMETRYRLLKYDNENTRRKSDGPLQWDEKCEETIGECFDRIG